MGQFTSLVRGTKFKKVNRKKRKNPPTELSTAEAAAKVKSKQCSIRHAAKLAGVSKSKMARIVRSGELPPKKRGPRKSIDTTDVEQSAAISVEDPLASNSNTA